MFLSTLLPLGCVLGAVYGLSVEQGSLRANGALNPIAVDTATPRLTWRLSSTRRGDSQTAYQIQTATSSSFASADLWDSGKVSAGDPYAFYGGKALQSRDAVFWRVKVWDADGQASDWSAATSFEISLLKQADWSAKWIANDAFATGNNSLPVFAKEFSVDCDVSKARLYLLGLGLHAPELNGAKIGDSVLEQGYTSVNKTLLYSTYDVTGQLVKGSNVLGVALGKGTYDSEKPLLGRYTKFSLKLAQQLKLISQLEYTCSSGESAAVYSDETWLTSVDGPYIEGAWYGGEEYDARKELPDWSKVSGDRSTWKKAVVTTQPLGTLVSPRSPPLKIVDTLPAVAVKQSGAQWVFDLGVNFAGWFTFTMNGTGLEGTRIVFYPSEKVNGNGAPDQSTTGTPIFDAYTLKGADFETYTTKWIYHGARYVGVNVTWTPSASDMVGSVIRADNEVVLETTTSNGLFNDIHKIIDRSIQGNMYSVLTDCPHREKYGWLEQDHLVFEPLAYGYDLQAYGDDLIRTIADAQTADVAGLIPDIAPEYGNPMGGGYRNDPNWGSACILVPLKLYRYYGDIQILQTRYQIMVDYINYLVNRSGGKPYLLDGGLGDWETLDTSTNKTIAVTFGYYHAVRGMSQVEELLGHADEAAKYSQFADDIAGAYHTLWFNTTGGFPHYCSNSQACNAMALDMGAVPAANKSAVLGTLISSIENNGWHLTVGEIALPGLFRALRAARRDDVLFNIMNERTAPGYGYQVVNGATSLWEHWDAQSTGGSLNHFMFGIGDMWILQLSGLTPRNSSVGWKEIDFVPTVVGDLTSASTKYRTPAGAASASWTRDGTAFSYDVTVPVGSTGVVYLNGTGITESGKAPKAGEAGVLSVRVGCQRTLVEVGSGQYSFKATLRA
ncbi:alpha-L-rhamnosidase [Thozetella sp. PMI_491]|nr:alpha-L-rhamnosidase [Thozetella sp. PMI_491]